MVADAVNVPPDPVTMILVFLTAVSGTQHHRHQLLPMSLPIDYRPIPRMPLDIMLIIHMPTAMPHMGLTPLIILLTRIYIKTMMASMKQLIVQWSTPASIPANLRIVKGNLNKTLTNRKSILLYEYSIALVVKKRKKSWN